MPDSLQALDLLLRESLDEFERATEAYVEAREWRNRVEAEVRTLESMKKRRVAELEASEGIQLVAAGALGAAPAPGFFTLTMLGGTGPDWASMDRTGAVERALTELAQHDNQSVSPAEIEQHLRYRGRDDDKEAVSGALAHLNRTQRAHRIGYAQWVPGPKLPTPDEFMAAVGDGSDEIDD